MAKKPLLLEKKTAIECNLSHTKSQCLFKYIKNINSYIGKLCLALLYFWRGQWFLWSSKNSSDMLGLISDFQVVVVTIGTFTFMGELAVLLRNNETVN